MHDFESLAKDNVLTVYAIWVKHIGVTYQKGVVQTDTSSNPEDVIQTFAFELDEKTLHYRVRNIRELDGTFQYDGYELDYWYVMQSAGEIILISSPVSSGGSVPRSDAGIQAPRSGASEIVVVGDKLYPDSIVSLTGDMTLKAVWKTKTASTLTYHANDGTPESAVPNVGEAIDCYVGDTVTVESGSGLKKGSQTFRYWSTTAHDVAGSTHYKAGDSLTIVGETHLYAIYEDAPSQSGDNHYYTVTYHANGGTGDTPLDSNHYYGGETVSVASKGNLVKADCTFKEWNTERDGSGTGCNGDGTDSFTMPKRNVTLYAIWLNSDGVVVYESPGTGDSLAGTQIAFSTTILALLAVGVIVIQKRKRHAWG